MEFWLHEPHIARDLERIEAALACGSRQAICELFCTWPLDVYALCYALDLSPYSHLVARLPRMPDPVVQAHWNGTSGLALLPQSVAFVKTLCSALPSYCGKRLEE